MTVAQMLDPQLYRKGSAADRAKAKADGIRNADAMKRSASSENKLFVDNVYTGTPLQINTSAIQHSIAGSSERQLRNAAAGAAVGQLAANAIPVNELIHKKAESQPWVKSGVPVSLSGGRRGILLPRSACRAGYRGEPWSHNSH